MKINLDEDMLARWAIGVALGDIRGEKWKEYDDSIPTENAYIQDIVFTVNGVELDFSLVIKRIDEKFDEAVTRAAANMYVEQFDRASDEITAELSAISEMLRDTVRTKFPDIHWGDYLDR